VLAFCRAFGDFGITLMVAGSIPGRTQTLPLAIYDLAQANRMHEANLMAAMTIVAVLVLLLGVGRLARVRY
jgi:molybdate transport system permease protein